MSINKVTVFTSAFCGLTSGYMTQKDAQAFKVALERGGWEDVSFNYFPDQTVFRQPTR